ncbi:hypothetical protein [Aquirhabdus parva]|uniref:Uncharacterized protein n=1 Tax=Aquirhabdus parva TaxID=2283318 RepID=A0A345P988_9GAMM|nr:hypothetical protein [Aquirhabdus parva]AXI03847.1 hypothetical protein HYN46_13985 [Aquirhabdus parva]
MNDASVILWVQHTLGLETYAYTEVKLFPDTGLHTEVEEDLYLAFNGWGYIKAVDGRDELIALYAYNNQLYLFFKHQSYVIDAHRSKAFFVEGLLNAVFLLKHSRRKVLRIVYKHDFEDNNILENLAKMLKPRNKEEVAESINRMIRFFTETDSEKKTELFEGLSDIYRKDFLSRILDALEHGGPIGRALYKAIWWLYIVGWIIVALYFLIIPLCKFLYRFLGGI